MLRDAINFKEAAKLLGAWDDRTFSDAERTNLKAQRAERIHVQAAAEEVEIEARRLRLEAGDWLRLLDRVKRRASDGLYAIHRGDGRDAEIFWGLLADLAPQIRTAIATYSLLAFGSCADVETFISHPEARSNMIERILSAGFVRDDAGRRVEVEL